MRLHRLELEGFGPFRERQSVDFDAFAADGIFLISGRTGAGKSSILDGVCFALYGSVPRYESGDRRIRSDHCAPDDPTEVRLEFTVGDTRWRVTRAPEYERPKRRGEGWAKVGAFALVEEWVDGEWTARASGPRNVAEVLDGVLQLTVAQFLQVILLAQNRFARFLLADSRERQAVLRTLFGSRRFEEYERALDDRRKRAEQQLQRGAADLTLFLDEAERIVAEAGGVAHGLRSFTPSSEDSGENIRTPRDSPRLVGADAGSEAPADAAAPADAGESRADAGALPGDEPEAGDGPRPTGERLAAVERALLRCDHRVEVLEFERAAAEAAHRAADAAHASRTTLRDAQERRARSRAALGELEQREPAMRAERQRLEEALRAEAVRDALDVATRAEAERAAAATAAAGARSAWAELVPDEAEASAAVLRERIDALSGDLAVWRAALVDEESLRASDAELEELGKRVAEQDAARAELDRARGLLPAQREQLVSALAKSQLEARGLDAATAALAAFDDRVTAARDAERLAETLRIAEAAQLERSHELEVASAQVTALLRRRLDGFAGELAAELVEGEPCAVCGATDHPAPALPATDPVTAAHLEAAEELKEQAIVAERAAAERAHAARAAHADASVLAGGESVAALTALREQAAATVAQARRAASERDRLQAELARLDETEAQAAAEHERLRTELAAARERLAVVAETATTARRRVDDARGGYASVADRIAVGDARRASARALVAALESSAVAEKACERACADRDVRVGEVGFSDADHARAALLPGAERSVLDSRIRDWETAREAERARLRDLELELADAPEELVDLEATDAARVAARAAWVASVDTVADVARTAKLLRTYVERARDAYGDVSELTAEHDAIVGVARAVAGVNDYRMTLETFVLAAELEEIVDAANVRLGEMSSGRYRLRHSDSRAARNAASGLGIEVVDAHTGQSRPAQSLSGGETFLASLALALGLAEVVTARAGGIRLDTLFIDEGFGALDADTLELAMRTLDELRQGGRTVGVISHVEAMKEDLPAQLVVEASPQGPSVIRQPGLPAS